MTTTTNLGLTKPTVGSTGWGSDINTNWDTLDGIFTAPSNTERHVYPGDSIQDAIDDVISAGGGSVMLHAGIHTFSSTISITNGDFCALIGQGDNTRLNYTGAGVAIDLDITTGDGDGIFLMNFRLEATGVTKGTHGIRINSGSPFVHTYWGLNVRSFTTAGILLDGTAVNAFFIGNCNITGNGIGIIGDKLTRGRIMNNVFFNNTTHGIQLKNASQYVKVIGNEIYKGSTAGISVEDSSTDIVVEGNTCDSQTGNGITVDTANRVVVAGNLVRSATGDGIKGNACTDLLIANNACFSCGSDGIDLANVDESAINSNRCKSNTGYGILADANCDQNLYDGNHTRGNTAGGLSDSGTNSTTGTNK